MDLKQLRALIAIAETGSVTKAAEILHIVQPAISRQVKLLEEELGVALFERERHGMVLTPAGQLFVERSRRALGELDCGRLEISPKTQTITGSVTVGMLPSAAELLVTQLMARVRQNYPHVTVRSYIAYVDDLEQSLERGDVDVALIISRANSATRYPSEMFLEESLYLVGPTDAGLDMGTPVPLSHLNEVPLILPPMPHGIRALVERECQGAGVKLSITAEANSMAVQKSLVMQGLGVSVLSGFVIDDEVKRGLLTAAPIDAPNLKRGLRMARAAGRAPSAAAMRVLEELRETIRLRVTDGHWPGARFTDD